MTSRGIRPGVGFSEHMPVKWAGWRTETAAVAAQASGRKPWSDSC